MSVTVVAVLGTDHHPFDRLVGWMDEAARRHPDVRFVVQHGASRAPVRAEGHAFLGHDALVHLLRSADVVVCHGGPGTITDARAVGHLPVCVPRDPELGEHVDGHQQRFADVAGPAGLMEVVRDPDVFAEVVARRIAGDQAADMLDADGMAQRSRQAQGRLARELDDLWRIGAARRAPRSSPLGAIGAVAAVVASVPVLDRAARVLLHRPR